MVFEAFGPEDHLLTLAELTRRTGIAKGTLHRLAATLVASGLLERVDLGYRLGRRLFELGLRASVGRGLVEVATPYLEELYEHTHETVHLGVRDGLDVVYLLKLGGHRQADTPSRLGGRLPLHCTALGKVLLAAAPPDVLAARVAAGLVRTAPRTVVTPARLRAQLDEVAATGLAYEHEESAVGIACVAAPITRSGEGVVAALSVTGPVHRFDPRAARGRVQAAAAGISVGLDRVD